MMAQISIGSHQGDLLRQYIDGMGYVDSHGHATIHSGHFMVSCVHEEVDDADSLPATVQGEDEALRDTGYDFESATREPPDSHQFGVISTNQQSNADSLASLIEHMTLAYSGKITSPKWKNFKGIKVKLKDKICLNNIIWREWHMQYIKRQKPIICQFETPISERTHAKPEAVVLEGKYWKRRLECLTTEYKKWRLFFKNRFSKMRKNLSHHEELDLRSELGVKHKQCRTQYVPNQLFDDQMIADDDCFTAFSDDTLFSTLNTPFAFPDAREISMLGLGDIIQPNLIQLQPTLDDELMDTLPPLPTVLSEFRDFGRGFGERYERYGSRKTSDARMIDVLLGGSELEFDSQQTQTPSLSSQTLTTPSDEYDMLDQLKQQLLCSGPATSDLFVTSSNSKLLSDTPTNISGDTFFTNSDQVVLPKESLQRRASDQPYQCSTISLDTGIICGVPQQQLISNSPQCGFFPSASDNLSSTIFQQVSSKHLPSVVQEKGSSSRQLPYLPTSSSVICSRYSGGVEQVRTTQQIQTGSSAALWLLQNQINPSACRRGSTGSLHQAKGKKHVTFVCPQDIPSPAATTKTTKCRTLVPAPPPLPPQVTTFCDKTSTGLLDVSQCKPGSSTTDLEHHPQTGTILAQLLMQGKSPTPHFSKSIDGGCLSNMTSASAAAKQSSSTETSCRPAYFALSSSVTPTGTNVTPTVQLQQDTLGMAPSFTGFHKSLPSAPVLQAPGATRETGNETASSYFKDMLSEITFSPPAVPTLAISSIPVTSDLNQAHNLNSDSNIDDAMRPPEYPRENRRAHHISAEQKRRSSIKTGFERLNEMVPELSAMSSGKINKATTLQKAAECCRRMVQERHAVMGEMQALKSQINDLQAEMSACQAKLPAAGVPVVRPQTNRSKVMFEEYVRNWTLTNWKFWIFSFLIRPLFDTYDETVVTTSVDGFKESVLSWLQQHCSLVALRPAVSESLRRFSRTSSILNDPAILPQEAAEAVSFSRKCPSRASFS